jgi:hypothetical protein
MAQTQKKPESGSFSGVSRDSLMPQGRRLRIAAVMASAMILAGIAGQGTASGLDVPSTSTLTTDPLSTTTTTVPNTVGTVTNTVGSTTSTLPSTTTSPSLPSSPTTTSPTTTLNNTTTNVADTTKTATKTVSTALPKTTSTTSSPTVLSSPTSSGVTRTLTSTSPSLTTSSGSGTSGGRTSGGTSGSGTSGSGPSGPSLLSSGGGTSGAAGGGPAGSAPLYSIQASKAQSILDLLARGSGSGRHGGAATIVELQNALSLLQGCFYGLSGRERRVLNMRAGLGGTRAHSRSYVAHRLNMTRGGVRRIEQNALFTLEGLADSTGCASGPGAAAAVADGYVSPGELARAPQLVTLANPAYQGAGQSQFSRLGTVPRFASGLPEPSLGHDPRAGAIWAAQLLAVMLGLGLVGLIRGAPALAAWFGVRRARLPARAVSARSPEPAPRPVHRHGQSQAPVSEGARPARREIQS